MFFRISSRFDKNTGDREDERFTDLTEWSIVKQSIHKHKSIQEDDEAFTLSKVEKDCNVSKFKQSERQHWNSCLKESLKNKRSNVVSVKPTGLPELAEIEARTHHTKLSHSLSKVSCSIIV